MTEEDENNYVEGVTTTATTLDRVESVNDNDNNRKWCGEESEDIDVISQFMQISSNEVGFYFMIIINCVFLII